jgi:predicted Fe-S protein YdhL (DUF1289 family)
MRGKSKPTESPCRDICTIDQARKLCTGCYRTLEEIAKWRRLSDAQRNKVLSVLAKRERQVKSGGRIS